MGLERFITAQDKDYETALAEITQGRKRSHWMWYIFPQVRGLGSTDISRYYAIKDIEEAADYLDNEILCARLTKICDVLLQLPTDDAFKVFGSPDDVKLRSSMTLFNAVPAASPVFGRVLAKFYSGKRDERTLQILGID